MLNPAANGAVPVTGATEELGWIGPLCSGPASLSLVPRRQALASSPSHVTANPAAATRASARASLICERPYQRMLIKIVFLHMPCLFRACMLMEARCLSAPGN